MKWRGLEYEECTWEMEGDLEGCLDLVQAFLDREKYGERGGACVRACFDLVSFPFGLPC